jgi:hypothetical protein
MLMRDIDVRRGGISNVFGKIPVSQRARSDFFSLLAADTWLEYVLYPSYTPHHSRT